MLLLTNSSRRLPPPTGHHACARRIRQLALGLGLPSLLAGGPAWAGPVAFLGRDLHAIASGRSALIMAGAAALTAGSLAIENPRAEERALGRGVIDPPADFGNLYGSGATLVAAAGALAGTGLLAHDPDWIRAGSEMARSVAYSGAIVTALKIAVRRTRPNGGPYSFPSGHTAAAFAVAPVLARHFGPAVGIPALALAVSTGLGRMEDRKHYLSDVVFGAGIGSAIGFAIASEKATGPLGLDVSPSGVALTAHF